MLNYRQALEEIANAQQRWMQDVGSYAGGETNAGFAARLQRIARSALETPQEPDIVRDLAGVIGRQGQQLTAIRTAAEKMLIGGNHLASALIGWLGTGSGNPPYTTTYEEAAALIKDVDFRDAWIAWKGIMEFRDALAAIEASQSAVAESATTQQPDQAAVAQFRERIDASGMTPNEFAGAFNALTPEQIRAWKARKVVEDTKP